LASKLLIRAFRLQADSAGNVMTIGGDIMHGRSVVIARRVCRLVATQLYSRTLSTRLTVNLTSFAVVLFYLLYGSFREVYPIKFLDAWLRGLS